MAKKKQNNYLNIMKVLEMTEDTMCSKYDYDWEDSESLEVKPEYIQEYDSYYLKFWNLIHNTNYLSRKEIK